MEAHMARKPDPLRAQIKALDAMVKTARAEQRAAERPVLAARRPLSESLRRAVRTVDYHNQKLADLIYDAAFRKGTPWDFQLKPLEVALAQATAIFNERLVALQTFDALHGVDGADYLTCPVLDRDATVAAAKADYARQLEDLRARMRADGCVSD
jgi:hypothetical protein